MKKNFIISVLLLLSISLFAQENTETSASGNSMEIRAGGFFNGQTVLGDLSEFVSSNIGAGICGELDLPFEVSGIKFGIPAAISFNVNPVNNPLLLSMWNMQLTSGAYLRFLFLEGQLVLQPELDYGVAVNFASNDKTYGNEISPVYADQIIQLAVYVKYAPKQLLDGALEFGLAPVYTLCPEHDSAAHYLGGRLEVLYRF